MSNKEKVHQNGIRELTPERGRQIFDRQVRKSLNISGQEFIQRWESGKYKNPDKPELIRLAMLIPLGRQ